MINHHMIRRGFTCSICNKYTESIFGRNTHPDTLEINAIHNAMSSGWFITQTKCYCPDCVTKAITAMYQPKPEQSNGVDTLAGVQVRCIR